MKSLQDEISLERDRQCFISFALEMAVLFSEHNVPCQGYPVF
jgi:hypothetical protein